MKLSRKYRYLAAAINDAGNEIVLEKTADRDGILGQVSVYSIFQDCRVRTHRITRHLPDNPSVPSLDTRRSTPNDYSASHGTCQVHRPICPGRLLSLEYVSSLG